MTNSRMAVLAGFILAAAAARLLPHPPNFTPLAAIALFGGAHFSSRRAAFGVPLAAMLLSDLLIGFHSGMAFIYGSFVLIVGMGLLIRARLSPVTVGGAAVGASVLFFVISNAGVWLTGGLYPMTGAGLLSAFVAAIPFFANTLAGDLLFTAVLFGGFALAERQFPMLREPVPGAAPIG